MTAPADPVIYMDDIRKTGHCVLGARRWFAIHRLDFRKFNEEGLPASVLLATNDDLARQVVAARLERDANG